MVLRCTAVGEDTQPEILPATEIVKLFLGKFPGLLERPRNSIKLTLNAMEEKKDWDPSKLSFLTQYSPFHRVFGAGDLPRLLRHVF